MNTKNVLTRLQAVEEKFSITKKDEEQKAKAEELNELLRKYEECMVEFRKFPEEQQLRLHEQEKEDFLRWYVAWRETYLDWCRANGDEHASRQSWQAYIRWNDSWNLEWEKTRVKSHDNALIFAKTGGD